MRMLIAPLLCAFSVSLASGADTNEDKAKEAAVALLKAIKSKDVDKVLPLMATPFLYREDGKPRVLKDDETVKTWLKEQLEMIKDGEKVPTTVESLTTFADFRDKIKDETDRKTVEDVVGENGYLAFVKSADDKQIVILVKFKDSKAKVVGIVTH